MTRALSLTCAFVLVVLLGGTAFAKPKIAVLGLEALDPQAVATGKELTDQLRVQARAGTGKYDLASNSDKELVDEKLMNTCDTELPSCMAPIGSQIGASRLLYGHIRLVSGNYIVDLALLNVDTKQREKAFANQRLAVADAQNSVKLAQFAKDLYKAITSESSTGTLIVEVQNKDVDRGQVQIDGDEKGFLTSGRLPIQNVAEGKHTLVVDVGGFQRFSKEVTVVANERITVPVTLTADRVGGGPIEKYGTESQDGGSNMWRPLFVTGAVLAAAGGVYWGYSYTKAVARADQVGFIYDPVDMRTVNDSFCDGKDVKGDFTADNLFPNIAEGLRDTRFQKLEDACRWRQHTAYGIAATAIGGAIMLGTFYSAWIKESNKPPGANAKRKKKTETDFAVLPVFGPNGGSVTLRLDW